MLFMPILSAKKNDWILYAFIFENVNSELSLEDLSDLVKLFHPRDSSKRRLAAVMAGKTSKGFVRLEPLRIDQKQYPIWSYRGELPEIPDNTRRNWLKILSRRDRGEEN